ncbi:hypothetical protein CVT91_08615 [Candidatus Atribacteria bacterium HGW-Atribacteria-1]|nr:MAG: hypothetical protein CVT91_08615 [Candidatus Atribacteria bacterium HGW-Atribacteria-1]
MGIDADAINNKIYLKPMLPNWINKIDVKNLKIDNNRVDFVVIKEKGRIKLSDVKVEGNIELIILK